MNIFYLDEDITRCAQYHCDKHVVKMVLETAQILCTVCWMHNFPAPYRPTHRGHPCVLWANQSLANWQWLKALGKALNEEFQYRFNHTRPHQSYEVILQLTPPPIPDIGLTPFAQALPEALKQTNAVLAYRQYYIQHKASIATWTKRETPAWFTLP